MTPPPRSLFLVEDNFDDETLAMRAISNSGVHCDVEVFRHGGEALAHLIAEGAPKPDLIVLDFHLPGLNGLEILRGLRKEEATRRIPIVILSNLESNEEVEACLEEGATSCVQKPRDFQTYVDHVGLIVRYWLTVDRRPELRNG